MTYWLLTTEYPPFHGGGISTYCDQTARMLASKGVQVTVFVPDDSIADHKIIEKEGAITLILFNSNRGGYGAVLGYTARLSYAFFLIIRHRIAEKGRPDIIEAQDYLGIAHYLLQGKYLLYPDVQDIPVLITLHSPAFLYLEANRVPVYRFPDFHTCEMEKQAIKMADHLISPTHFLVDAINPYIDISDRPLSVIRNPYALASPGSDEKPSSPEKASALVHPTFTRGKIVYYGKLSPQKGSFELLSYMKGLWDKGFAHPLHVIGGTDIVYHPEQLTMGQIVQRDYDAYIQKGLLILHGKIAPSSVAAELSTAQVIVVPSIIDNLPYVVIEAMALGKVVLASVQGGQREMIDEGSDGYLFDHRQPGNFEAQLNLILSLSDDKIKLIGQAARAKVSAMYDPGTIAREKLQVFHRIATTPGRKVALFPFIHQEPYTPLTGGDRNGKLSIVIPFYNMGKFIHETLRSIKASTHSPFEILIIDDGSNEPESLAVLQEIALQDGVKIFHRQNEGLAETRNYGARQASGEFLAFLDADDQVCAEYYEKAIRVLREYRNVFFAGSWVQYFGESAKAWISFLPQPPYLLVHNTLNSSGLVYKKEAFLQAGLNDKHTDYGLEDYESLIHLMSKGYNGIVLPELLFRYRVRSGSMFRKITREKLLYAYKYITERHAAYYAKFATETINLLNANGPGFLFDNPTFAGTVYIKAERRNRFISGLKSAVRKNKTLKKIALKIIKQFTLW